MLIRLIFGLADLAAIIIGIRAIITRKVEYSWTDSDSRVSTKWSQLSTAYRPYSWGAAP